MTEVAETVTISRHTYDYLNHQVGVLQKITKDAVVVQYFDYGINSVKYYVFDGDIIAESKGIIEGQKDEIKELKQEIERLENRSLWKRFINWF